MGANATGSVKGFRSLLITLQRKTRHLREVQYNTASWRPVSESPGNSGRQPVLGLYP